MKIAVIIPVHNGGAAFERCLQSIAALDPAPDEVIVVPDGESDGAWRAARAYGAHVLEPSPAPRGPAHARNRGAQAATSDLLFFVDADVMVHADALREIHAAFRADPDLDALIGSYDDAPGAPEFLSQYRNLLHHYVHQTAEEDASTFWGACGAVRREVFLACGGFDAQRFPRPSVEDIELGYRIKREGGKITLRKTLLVTHLKRWTAASIVRTDFACRALPWTELILQYKAMENNLNLRTESRASVVAVGVGVLAFGAAAFWPAALLACLLAVLALLALNAPLYRFFLRKRGVFFTLGVLPWHWLYFLYGGVAFGLGLVRYHLGAARPRPEDSVPA